MPLTDKAVKQAKPKIKDYKLADKEGMYLHVKVNGSKYWRFKYRFNGKEKVLALGVYPGVTLKDARAELGKAKDLLQNGGDPSKARKEKKLAKKIQGENVFENIAREWCANQKEIWSDAHSKRVIDSFTADVFPQLGNTPVSEITAQDLLSTIRKIENRGALDVAGRVLQRSSAVFRYAIQTGRATYNPATDLQGTLKTRKP